MTPPTSLHLSPQTEAVLRLAFDEGVRAAVEPCGYLLGRDGPAGRLLVVRAEPGRNVHPAPAAAFRLAPEEHLAVRRVARAEDLRVVGCWHGHLEGPARPSRADADGLGPLGPFVALIIGREGAARPRLRAWWRDRDAAAWRELPLLAD